MKTVPRFMMALVAIVALAATSILLNGSADAKSKPKPHPHGYDILFVRHAHTVYPYPEQELDALGIEQAATLVQTLKNEPLRSVDTSLMVRTFQTADGVAGDHNLSLRADEDINEIKFDLTGLAAADWTSKLNTIMEKWLNGEQRGDRFCESGNENCKDATCEVGVNFCQGENYYEVRNRWNRWWTNYVREHRNDSGEGLVVAHGAIFMVMLPATCSNKISTDFVIDNGVSNTGIIRAHLSPSGKLTCTSWDGKAIPGAPTT
ncbi:MAG: histidine phosphatase family protein [Nocardioidaceae bacterium]